MEYIEYIIPLVLGALIGYVTNLLAIRMLFRPFRAWYVWGFRIPLTPGVIPRYRGELARNIGNLFGDLVQKGMLLEHLKSEKMQKILEKMIDLKRIYAFCWDFVHKDNKEGFEKTFIPVLEIFFKTLVEQEYVEQEYKEKQKKSYFEESVFVKWFEGIILDLRSSRVVLKEMVSEKVQNDLLIGIETHWHDFLDLLKKEVEKTSLLSHLLVLFEQIILDYIENLKPLQRLMIRSTKFQEKLIQDLPGFLEKGIRGIFEELKSQQIIEEFIIRIGLFVDTYLEKELGELVSKINPEEYGGFVQNISEILSKYLSKADWLSLLKRVDFRDIFRTLFVSPGLDEQLFKEVFKLLGPRVRSGFLAWIQKDSKHLLSVFDFVGLIEHKVNELPLKEMERLLFELMQRHFRWIHLFGALLGFLLGAIQLLLKGFIFLEKPF